MTIGGMLATNVYGPSSLRYGTLKDLIVGIEIVRADGVIARGGGKVVKNVAGFDLSKLMVGALGTLAVVSKASFRVHPLPEKRRSISLQMSSEGVFPFVLAVREAQMEPSAIVAELLGPAANLDVWFEGFTAGVDAQVDDCSRLAASFAADARVDAPQQPFNDDDRAVTFHATFPPSTFAQVAPKLSIESVRVRAFPATGALWGDADTTLDAATVLSLRTFFESLGGKLVVHRMPAVLRETIDAWGTPPPSFELMRSLKYRFDPHCRLNPGRFVGGL
jgi:glycolate oxidase FAD binding subunit